jgi:transcription antitermination factor NusG
MATKSWTEAEIKSLIKDTLKQELKDIQNSMDDIKVKQKKQTDEEQVKEIVRQTLVNMYKFLWQKSNNYIRQI